MNYGNKQTKKNYRHCCKGYNIYCIVVSRCVVMKNYPFVKCISPVVIKHPVTGEKMIVGCGKCCACRNAKNGQLALKCKLESKSHKYCYFVTLTYDQEHIPLMRAYPVKGTNGSNWMFVSICDRLDETGLIINECDYRLRQVEELAAKCNLHGLFPYLSSRDAQLFVKRLRKYISKITDENIRFFLCGEFGPKSLRPHFHLILWFDNEQVAANMENLVNQSWQFGRTDCQAVRNDASSYVAGYLNSPHTLPKLYQTGKSQPFANHSQLLGEDVLACKKTEVYKLSPREFVRRSMELNGSVADFSLWRGIKNRFYPRCRDFATKSHDERMRLYTLIDCVSARQTAHRKPLQLAHEIVTNCIHKRFDSSDISSLVHYYDDLYRISNAYYSAELREDLLTADEYEHLTRYGYVSIAPLDMDLRIHAWLIRVTNQIYHDLLISTQFCDFVCDGIRTPIHRDTMLKFIEHFYESLDLSQLGNFYLQQKEYFNEFGFDNKWIDLFYNDDSIYDLTESEIFKIFKYDQMRQADEFMKHKRQNDANRFWFRERDL